MRQALGTAVFFGMLGVTFFGIFLTPVFYSTIRRLTRNAEGHPQPPEGGGHPPETSDAPGANGHPGENHAAPEKTTPPAPEAASSAGT